MAVDESAAERQSDLAVMDANEYKQKRRLKRILDAHDRVEDKADEAYELYVTGQITEDAKNIMLLRSVQEYIREIYNLLLEYDQELEEDETNIYWSSAKLGDLELEHGENIPFIGLASILNAQKFYIEEWEEQVETRHGPNRSEEREQHHTVPEEVSWNAYLLVNQFLSEEKDVEIRFEELKNSLPVWGFEEVENPDEDDVVL